MKQNAPQWQDRKKRAIEKETVPKHVNNLSASGDGYLRIKRRN